MARVTLYSLSDYNQGILISHGFDMDDYDNQQEYFKVVADWLEDLDNKLGGVEREGWIIADHQGILNYFIDDYDLNSDYWVYKDIVDNTEVPEKAVEVWFNYGYPLNKESIVDNYLGEYSDDEEFVCDILVDRDKVEENLPYYIQIDWKATACNFMQDYFTGNNHYFRIC